MLDPLLTSRRIEDTYRRYLYSTFEPRREDLRHELTAALSGDFRLSRGPFLQASAPFEPGKSVSQLVDEGVLSDGFRRLSTDAFPIERSLHLHQETAIRKAVTGRRNLVVATGTGSGKTETFLLPILDHLLRESEAGTLQQPGVRALLLYPMNALANDQVKRLRQLLADLPEITFGRYVGETAYDEDRARDDFYASSSGADPLPNELLSRDRMKETPPHILLTNYAMLEYLLLRPADSALFDGDTSGHWRFVALDEAHVYNGAQGTEVAMLLRRVRDRVVQSEEGRLQCFATSATLGRGVEDHPDLVDFASDLFAEPFEWDEADTGRQDVVVAVRKPLAQAAAAHRLPEGLYRPLAKALHDGVDAAGLAEIVQGEGESPPAVDASDTPAAWLWRLLSADERVIELQEKLEKGSDDFRDVAGALFSGPDADADLVALIDLCVVARVTPDDAPLLPARYHFFLRAIEGGFLCSHPSHPEGEPRLRITRYEHCPSCIRVGRTTSMAEFGVCRTCRAEYLVGELSDGTEGELKLINDFAPARAYLLIGAPLDADDEDEAAAGVSASSGDPRLYCPECGHVTADAGKCACDRPPTPIKVTLVRPTDDEPVLRACAACAARRQGEVVQRLTTGTDAPVSVIATDLYQELPPSQDTKSASQVGQGRKLLAFSDSRQDAAFFAPYLERTYNRSMQRRLIFDVVRKLAGMGDPPRGPDIVVEARKAAEKAWVLDPDASAHTNNGEVGAWVFQEYCSVDRRLGLEGTGMAEIAVAIPRRFDVPPALLKLGFTAEEAVDLIQLLLQTVRIGGAVTTPPGVDVKDDRFAPRNFEFGVRERGSERGIIAWCPADRSLNRRLEIVEKALDRIGADADAREVLTKLWRLLTDRAGDWSDVLVSDDGHGTRWRLNWERFDFLPLADDHRPSKCDRCGQLAWRTIRGLCPAWRCSGTVHEVTDLGELERNHYARLYRELSPIGLQVQEHTAQWRAKKARTIQEDFVRGRINVLSCSTTFELGVDVGEVQAVLLRNVPPSPANYVQRAGRAGRRTDSAALVVTFAQRRSHDLTFFANPTPMVDGTILPPQILLDNASIVRRHVHSIAYAAFSRRVVEQGRQEFRQVRDFFEAGEGTDVSADSAFVEWLRTRPADVGAAASRVVPTTTANAIGLDEWQWVEALVEPSDDEPTHGWLTRAAEEYREEIDLLEERRQEYLAAEDGYGISRMAKVLKTLRERQILGFLASRNVLPKYGFPVDVVELNVAGSGDSDAADVDLSRDLKLAISDYAPGASVVAAKALWKSTGLGVRSNREWPTYKWGVCADCGAFRQTIGESLGDCTVCGSTKTRPGSAGSYVSPVFGFVGKKAEAVGESRPPRSSVSETFFGAYREESNEVELVPELSVTVPVSSRTSRQGRIVVVNRGPRGRGFRMCSWCGYAEPAPKVKRAKGPQSHNDIRKPGRECTGNLYFHHLGHEYFTDVTEVRIACAMDDSTARSALAALLSATDKLGIMREDLDGTLYRYSPDEAPALVLFDAVPGGAGHAQRIAEDLPTLFRTAFSRVETCECGIETSCYQCLRTYRNQPHHGELVRGRALDVLRLVLGFGDVTAPTLFEDTPEDDLSLVDEGVRNLLREVLDAGAPPPVVGLEPGSPDGAPVELGWVDARVAVTIDDVGERDEWLRRNGWEVISVLDADAEKVAELVTAGPRP